MKKLLIILMSVFMTATVFAQSWQKTENAHIYTAGNFTLSIPTNLQWISYPNFDISFTDFDFAYYENAYITYGYNYMTIKGYNENNYEVWKEEIEFYIDKKHTNTAHSAINSEKVNKILNAFKSTSYIKMVVPIQIDINDIAKGKYKEVIIFKNPNL